MKRLLYGVTTAQGAGATSATNALSVRNSAGTSLLVIGDDGAVRVGTNASATTQTTASISATGSETNIGLALVPKGNGAITASIPDGTSAGGDARGIYAVDLQTLRTLATQVASGNESITIGTRSKSSGLNAIAIGYLASATKSGAVAIGGTGSFGVPNATGVSSYALGGSATASSTYSGVFAGRGNIASASFSVVLGGDTNNATNTASAVIGGVYGLSNLYSQITTASGSFSGTTTGDAQTSHIRYRNAITGTAKTELFLDGASVRAILALPTGATAGRVWNAKIQVVAVCTVQGAGTVTVGEVFGGNYAAIIKRIGSSTSIVGAGVISAGESYDTNMESSIVTISADDTNESLKIEFTPPTTAAADTVIRVVATVYLTEVGY